MVIENISDFAPQALVDAFQPFLLKLSVIVGGIFGLYVILLIVRIYYERRNYKILKDIRYDLDQLNLHYNLPNSSQRKGILRRFTSHVRNRIRKK